MTVFELLKKSQSGAPVAPKAALEQPQSAPAQTPTGRAAAAPPPSSAQGAAFVSVSVKNGGMSVALTPPAQPAPAAPAPPSPDISDKALLVSFAVSIPGNEKVDRDLTKKVQKSENMGAQSGKWDKTIFPPALYKPISTVASAARAWHYANTLPWPIKGTTILPLANHAEYCKGVREWKGKLADAANTFIAHLPDIVKWAQREHNGSFDAALYDADRIRSKFAVGVNFLPIPASDQFTSRIREIVGADASAVSDLVAQATRDAQRDLWQRLVDPLRNITAILAKKEHGDRTRITESLLGSVLEIANLIPALNITGDPQLDRFAAEAKAAFAAFSQSDLTDDTAKRKAAIQAADDILRRMTGLIPQ